MSKSTKYPCPEIAPAIFYDTDFCPVRAVLQAYSGKWPTLILMHLHFGPHRFSQLLGAIPDISQRMLTQSLRTLERDGLVHRKATATVPPRVDYSLTPLGRSYYDKMSELLNWGAVHRAEIERNQAEYDQANLPSALRLKAG